MVEILEVMVDQMAANAAMPTMAYYSVAYPECYTTSTSVAYLMSQCADRRR